MPPSGDQQRQPTRLLWRDLTRIPEIALSVPLRFIAGWLTSRPRQPLLLGTPAVVCAAACLLASASASRTPIQDTARAYRTRAAAAVEQGSFKEAELWLNKLVLMNESTPADHFQRGLIATSCDDHNRARAIMRQLAPPDAAGYGPAHLWLADDIMRIQQSIEMKRVPELRHHLIESLKYDALNTTALEWLARLELRVGRVDAGIETLHTLARERPEFAAALARLYQTTNRPELALDVVDRALRDLDSELAPTDRSIALSIQRAGLERIVGRFDQAELLLVDQLQTLDAYDDRRSQIRRELSATMRAWSGHISRIGNGDAARQLRILQRGLRHDPTDTDLRQELVRIIRNRSNGSSMEQTGTQDDDHKQLSIALSHLVAGTNAMQQGDLDEAERHLRSALTANPQLPVAANNLAWLLAHRDPPDLKQARLFADVAVRLAPNHPELRATRGVIRARMGDTQGAMDDLQFAVEQGLDRADIRQELIQLDAHAESEPN